VTSGDPKDDIWVKDYIDAGATWLVECIYPGRGGMIDGYFELIQKGPQEF